MGALEASREQEAGLPASRAAPVPGAMADPGIRDAMAVQSAWAAMADPGSHGGSGDSVALALGPATQAMAIRPPPKKFLGEVPPSGSSSGGTGSVGHSGSADTWGRSAGADT